jgi:hypothetical protein
MPRRFYYFDEQAESWDEMVNPKPVYINKNRKTNTLTIAPIL